MAANAVFKGGAWRSRAGRFIGPREAQRRRRISDTLVSRAQSRRKRSLLDPAFEATEVIPPGEQVLLTNPFDLVEVVTPFVERLFDRHVNEVIDQIPEMSVFARFTVTMTVIDANALPARVPRYDQPIVFQVQTDVAVGVDELFAVFLRAWISGFRERFEEKLYEIEGEQRGTLMLGEDLLFVVDRMSIRLEG